MGPWGVTVEMMYTTGQIIRNINITLKLKSKKKYENPSKGKVCL